MTQMTAPTTDRRKFLALGSAGALAALAGCGAFRDTQGTPGTSDPPEDRQEGHPPDEPLPGGNGYYGNGDDGDGDNTSENGE